MHCTAFAIQLMKIEPFSYRQMVEKVLSAEEAKPFACRLGEFIRVVSSDRARGGVNRLCRAVVPRRTREGVGFICCRVVWLRFIRSCPLKANNACPTSQTHLNKQAVCPIGRNYGVLSLSQVLESMVKSNVTP